jgi:hypothetical protein
MNFKGLSNNDILWAKAYNNNTHLKAAVRYKKTRSTTIER